MIPTFLDGDEFDEECDGADDGQHCSCWYDGFACCGCDAPGDDDDLDMVEFGD